MNEWLQMLLGQPGAAGASASTQHMPLPLPPMPMQGLPPGPGPAVPMQMAEALDPNSDEAWNMRMRQALDDPTAPHTIWPGLEPSLGGEGLAPMTPQNDNGMWPPLRQVGMPLPPPRPKEQARMGLDTTGLAALSADAARYWPETAKEIGEAYGAPLPPPDAAFAGFTSPGFIGPMPPVAQRTTPFRNEVPARAFEGMMDPNTPVSNEEYEMLVRRMFQLAQPGQPGSTWR